MPITLRITYLQIFFSFGFLVGCISQVTIKPSAKELNDSAVTITNHFKDTSEFEEAIFLLKQAIEKDSTYFDLYKNKYFFEIAIGKFKSALITNRKLIEFRPDSADLFFQSAILEQYLLDTTVSERSFAKAEYYYKVTLDTMNANNPLYFYYWRLWACSMIMTGQGRIIHDYLKENCINGIDSSIYHPDLLSKTKSELREFINGQLIKNAYRH